MEKIKEKGQLKNKKLLNYGARERTIFWITVFVILFADILIWGTFIGEDNLYVDLLNKFIMLNTSSCFTIELIIFLYLSIILLFILFL